MSALGGVWAAKATAQAWLAAWRRGDARLAFHLWAWAEDGDE